MKYAQIKSEESFHYHAPGFVIIAPLRIHSGPFEGLRGTWRDLILNQTPQNWQDRGIIQATMLNRTCEFAESSGTSMICVEARPYFRVPGIA